MSDARMLRVLIVDDEPLGCRRIANLLRNRPDVEVVGVAEDGDAAIAAIRADRPDLVFLDIQMPRKTGLEVVQEIGAEGMPVTVFVTAYDEFALRAFDLAAVDYLVKPFDNERFEEAFRRARRLVEWKDTARAHAQLRSVLDTVFGTGPARIPAAPRYLDRIAVPMRGKMRVVPVAEVDYITASGSYAELHVGSARHLVREPLQALEEQLDPDRFLRIHRSVIVRVDRIEALLRAEGGHYEVQLRGGVRLKVSRDRRRELEQRLGRTT
jgi:two-component system LytT family response regulator